MKYGEKLRKEAQKKALEQIIGTLSAGLLLLGLLLAVSYANHIEQALGLIK